METEFDAVSAFEANLKGPSVEGSGEPAKPAEPPVEHFHPETHEEPSSEAVEAPEGASAEPAGSPDDDEVELPFGAEAKRFSVKELRELIEKRDAIAAREAELAKNQPAATPAVQRAQKALQTMLDRAKAKAAPYAGVDWLSISRDPNIDQPTFETMRQLASEAEAEVAAIEAELKETNETATAEQQATVRETAQKTLTALSDPKTGIPGWGPALYQEIMQHAVSQGLSPQLASSIVEEAPIRLLHDAMMYRKGLARATEQSTKVVNKPTRVIKPGAKADAVGGSRTSVIKSMRAAGGDTDAAAAAFEALARAS